MTQKLRAGFALALVTSTACGTEPEDEGTISSALSYPAPGDTLTIGFETDANDQPIARGALLDEQYAGVGVHFNGAFSIGVRSIDFPDFKAAPYSTNMICTWVAWQDTNKCFAPVGIMAAQLVVDLDFDACDVTIEGRTRGDGNQDGDILTMVAYDAAGAQVSAISDYMNTGPNPTQELVHNGTVSGEGIRRVVIEDGELDGLDTLVVHRCEPKNQPPQAVCGDRDACNVQGQCYGIANIDAGSSDPDGDPLTLTQSPANPYPVGTTPVTLTVNDGTETSTCQAEVTINDCEDPTIACPAPAKLECTGNRCASYSPAGAIAADNCGIADSTNPSAQCFPLGTTGLAYGATDAAGNSVSCSSSVTVVDTLPPSIACPAPETRECLAGCGQFTPGAASASDICAGTTVTRPGPACFPLGTTSLPYTATDEVGLSASCSSSITVVDTQAPTVVVGPSPSLSPPNHNYQTINLATDCGVVLDDACQGEISVTPTNAAISCVTSDEDDNATGDGNTVNDIIIVDSQTVQLRAERSGNGDGRVYSIGFTVTDAAGNKTPGTCKVLVNKGSKTAIDSGPVETVCR